MALSLDQLKNAFKKNEPQNTNRPNNYYPFWNMKTGESATIRFLPDKNSDNPLGFMVEKFMHNLVVNGEKKNVPCLKMYEEDCPICKVSNAYYKAEDKVNGQKYWRKKQHITQALIVSDPLPPNAETGETHQGKVRFIALGYQLFNVIKEAFESGELDNVPYEFNGGYEFIIKKTMQGEYSTYSVGSRFRNKPVNLTDDEVDSVQEHMIDLRTLLPQNPGLDKVEAMLEASLTGASYAGDSNVDDTVDADAVVSTKVTSAVVKESTPVTQQKVVKSAPVVEENEDDDEAEAERILSEIRARRAKA